MKTKQTKRKKVVSKISQTPHDKTKSKHQYNMLIEGVPLTTKVPFKAKCAANDITMRDVLITFMRQYVNEG